MSFKYTPKNPIRIVTAASLFDGHDATINIIRRMLQEAGAEVIHLGHNRSVADVVKAILQEGAQGVCISSYQGGHMEYFKYMRDLLDSQGSSYVRIFGGGGGVIVHEEKAELEKYGISQIFHPDDGRRLGLEGMIDRITSICDFEVTPDMALKKNEIEVQTAGLKLVPAASRHWIPSRNIGLMLNFIENSAITQTRNTDGFGKVATDLLGDFQREKSLFVAPIVGITGTGGAGKSSLVDELVQRFLNSFPDIKIAVLCVDPSKRKTGGSLLGDRIRMNSLSRERTYMRSLASRGSGKEISESLPRMIDYIKTLDFDLVIAETSGIGQGNMAITQFSDISMYVMTSDFGAQSQLEKIDMIDYADLIAINKADRRGSQDALRDVSKQFRRSRKLFSANGDEVPVPVHLTQASQFNDKGVNELFFSLVDQLAKKTQTRRFHLPEELKEKILAAEENAIIPPHRQAYLAEIVQSIRAYKTKVEDLAIKSSEIWALQKTKVLAFSKESVWEEALACLAKKESELRSQFVEADWLLLQSWDELQSKYKKDDYVYKVRGKEFKQKLYSKSLSGTRIPKVSLPRYESWGDRFRFLKLENVPGEFPYTAGVFPLKREDEDPKRMFAGEGGPERTNNRFHFLCKGEKAHRLSTAFDSVTLYGHDPDLRPDIYGKVGESGVSISTLEDMKKLYKGFDLVSPNTSVSMTINGPAPMILAFFFNSAIAGEIEKEERKVGRSLTESERNEVETQTLQKVRGTVQADILKEDQGQNTCIFSINFALKMMGDIQEYFVSRGIRNFYSVSISGYHIAEAGANPISQLAFTLSNGFTFVEYYLSRGLKVDDFAPNLSFFFSNGLDPEYSVLGRVARRIWAIAMKDLYKGNDRSQKLKYHIQTSGRSLHAQEIDFNDIRTTLQALLAIYDNCNSLHTNAYDEAITTPTEESVRRAMAIQMIINREFGLSKNENPIQGAFIIEELTELVEEAVLSEFLKLSERGGVLGAMEHQYQRSKIQEESMYYEHLKHSGEFPVIGVNTFINPRTLESDYVPAKIELARATKEEKDKRLDQCDSYKKANVKRVEAELSALKHAALSGQNIFAALMKASNHCSLYQMTQALFEVGGQYRRNI